MNNQSEMKITDKEIVDWLSSCNKIDHSGYDAGWAFERMVFTDEPIGVCDVRIAVRGFDSMDGLRLGVNKAIAAEKKLTEQSAHDDVPRRQGRRAKK